MADAPNVNPRIPPSSPIKLSKSYTVGKNARSSKTKMYKQKSDELPIITLRYMHKAKKTTPVPYLFLK